MKISIRQLELTADQVSINDDEPPFVMIKRTVSEGFRNRPRDLGVPTDQSPWWVLHDRLPKPGELQWFVDRGKGAAQVAIPLYMYQLEGAELCKLTTFGLQFAALLCNLVPRQRAELLLIATSQIFSRPDGRAGYLVYVGAAYKEIS